MVIDMEEVLKELSKERPVFHSEADFQHALAWKIHEKYQEINIRLEKRIELSSEPIRVDIYLWDREGKVSIVELKYKTKKDEVTIEDEKFELKDQGAQDLARYDFLKDVERLEKCVIKFPDITGYAIFLTNDPKFWEEPKNKNREPKDKDFRIHEGRVIHGTLKWKNNPPTKDRKDPIILRGCYKLSWKIYSTDQEIFKYLLVKVDKSSIDSAKENVSTSGAKEEGHRQSF